MDTTNRTMNREEFFAAVKASGYAWKKTAVKYAEGRDTFTEDDLIEVYRIEQNAKESIRSDQEKYRFMFGGDKTTKRYTHDAWTDFSGDETNRD